MFRRLFGVFKHARQLAVRRDRQKFHDHLFRLSRRKGVVPDNRNRYKRVAVSFAYGNTSESAARK